MQEYLVPWILLQFNHMFTYFFCQQGKLPMKKSNNYEHFTKTTHKPAVFR